MRSANDLSRLPLAQALLLPPEDAAISQAKQNGHHSPRQTIEKWSDYAGGYSVSIARNLEEARHRLLQALDIVDREPVLLPANATHPLVEVVKQSGAIPIFGELNQDLQLSSHQHVRIVWSQPLPGILIKDGIVAEHTVLDYSDSVPLPALETGESSFQADVTIFDLHLSPDPKTAGALLVFNSEALYARFIADSRPAEPTLYARAASQLKRLPAIVSRQVTALDMVSTGLQVAAGLPAPSVFDGIALAHGVAVQIPDEGSPSTFWTYASSENTPVQWLPQLRPVHYAAIASHLTTARHLERWLMVPVSPDNDAEANKQTVLGIVKAAEYMGLRWRTDPAQAAHYAALLNARYGSDHDAYRPAFSIEAKLPTETMFCAEDVVGPACRV